MKGIFYTAGGLLCLDGLLHLVKVAVGPWTNATAAMVLTALFGLAYLAIGVMLIRVRESMVWSGLILPVVGLLLTIIGLKPNPDVYTIAFIVLDVLVIAACGYLLYLQRAPIHRVS